MARLASFALILVICQTHHLTDRTSLMVQSDRNKALHGHTFLNISGITKKNCLERCLANCLCISYQVCGDVTPVTCQLCSSDKYLNPQSMRESKGCTSFNFGNQYEVSNQQCGQSCASVINCCMTSNPCLNGGTCPPPIPSSRKRFRCMCQDSYHGDRCDIEHCKTVGYTGQLCDEPIRSCRGYSTGRRVSGKYTVIDVNKKAFEVFCSFDKGFSMTWTLIQSYAYQNRNRFTTPLSEDAPVNENNPLWTMYRLSKSRMESIQEDSTKWSLTRYEPGDEFYKDYIRGAKSLMNILTFTNSGKWVKMEYMNVRGQFCNDCTTYWKPTYFYKYLGYYMNQTNGCDFNPCSYFSCSSSHRESYSSSEDIIQIWLGGDE